LSKRVVSQRGIAMDFTRMGAHLGQGGVMTS